MQDLDIVTPTPTTAQLQTLVEVWLKNKTLATDIWGDIGTWNVSNVTSMEKLLLAANSFNDNIDSWV